MTFDIVAPHDDERGYGAETMGEHRRIALVSRGIHPYFQPGQPA